MCQPPAMASWRWRRGDGVVAMALLCIMAVSPADAYADSWPTSSDGGCGLLVSGRHQNDGMGGSGYAVQPAEAQDAVLSDSGVVVIPLLIPQGSAGWFITVETGVLSRASAGCSRFSSGSGSTPSEGITWTPPAGATGAHVIEVAYAPCYGQISFYQVRVNLPPPTGSPPTGAPSPPPPTLTEHRCDIAVIGQGLAGATAAAAAASLSPGSTVCSIGPGPESSTSSLSGRGWLLLPDASDAALPRLLDELRDLAARHALPFDRARAEHFVRSSAEATEFVASAANVNFLPVAAYPDTYSTTCADVDCACDGGLRTVAAHGAYPCGGDALGDVANEWYRASGCCGRAQPSDVPLTPPAEWQSWPPYHHLHNLLAGQIKWAVGRGAANVAACSDQQHLTLTLLTALLATVPTILTGVVRHATYDESGAAWLLTADTFTVRATTAIFATGGFGAVASAEELARLGVASTAEVHARNTGLLWQTAKREGWATDQINGW